MDITGELKAIEDRAWHFEVENRMLRLELSIILHQWRSQRHDGCPKVVSENMKLFSPFFDKVRNGRYGFMDTNTARGILPMVDFNELTGFDVYPGEFIFISLASVRKEQKFPELIPLHHRLHRHLLLGEKNGSKCILDHHWSTLRWALSCHLIQRVQSVLLEDMEEGKLPLSISALALENVRQILECCGALIQHNALRTLSMLEPLRKLHEGAVVLGRERHGDNWYILVA